jgi:hypothetical protein
MNYYLRIRTLDFPYSFLGLVLSFRLFYHEESNLLTAGELGLDIYVVSLSSKGYGTSKHLVKLALTRIF